MAFKVFGKKIDKIGLLGLSLLGLLVFHMIYGCTICKEGNQNMSDTEEKEEKEEKEKASTPPPRKSVLNKASDFNQNNANKEAYEKQKKDEEMLNSFNTM